MEQKRGEGKQRFYKGGKLGQGVDALKRGAGTPLGTMLINIEISSFIFYWVRYMSSRELSFLFNVYILIEKKNVYLGIP